MLCHLTSAQGRRFGGAARCGELLTLRLADLTELGGLGVEDPGVRRLCPTLRGVRVPPTQTAPAEGAMLVVSLALPWAQVAASCFPEGTVMGTEPDSSARLGAPAPARVSWKIRSLDLCS